VETTAVDNFSMSSGGFLLSFVDGGLSAVARRSLRVRAHISPGAVARGRMDVLLLELGDVRTAKLTIDRLLLRAMDVHVGLGDLQPRLRARDVGVKVTISQPAIDEWAKSARIPARFALRGDGLFAITSAFGRQVSEVQVALETSGSTVVIRPVRTTILQRSSTITGRLRWPLPLRLPSGVSLLRVEHEEGSLTAYLGLPDIDEAVPARVLRVVRRKLTSMLIAAGKSTLTTVARRLVN
jgi:hypothetical protein